MDGWQRKDVWLGVAFLAAGALVVIYAVSAMQNGASILWWGGGWPLGVLLVLIGGNALVRSWRGPER